MNDLSMLDTKVKKIIEKNEITFFDNIILNLHFIKKYLQNIPQEIIKNILTLIAVLKYYVWSVKMHYNSPKDEFDSAYYLNTNLYSKLTKNTKKIYLNKLTKYRYKAHINN